MQGCTISTSQHVGKDCKLEGASHPREHAEDPTLVASAGEKERRMGIRDVGVDGAGAEGREVKCSRTHSRYSCELDGFRPYTKWTLGSFTGAEGA